MKDTTNNIIKEKVRQRLESYLKQNNIKFTKRLLSEQTQTEITANIEAITSQIKAKQEQIKGMEDRIKKNKEDIKTLQDSLAKAKTEKPSEQ